MMDAANEHEGNRGADDIARDCSWVQIEKKMGVISCASPCAFVVSDTQR